MSGKPRTLLAAALRRDFVWTLLWRLGDDAEDGWVQTRDVYLAWLDGRGEFGIAFAPDYMTREAVTRDCNWLVGKRRAERHRPAGRLPHYRVIVPPELGGP